MAKNFKKFFTAVTVAATIVYSVGLAAFVPAANAAVSAGTLVKASGAAVYYVGADMKRYVFPDEKSFKTWYADFSSVVTITDAELAAMAIGGNVTYRPGTKLIKITTDPKVYAVDAHGTLRWVTTEAIATCLYGASWGSYVQDVPDPFFVNYTQGNQINACSEFVPASVTAAATSINVDKGLSATVEGPVLSGGSVMVSVSSDTPASQTVPTDASVEIVKFNLKAGSAAAQISSITLTSTGLNDANDINDATLYVDGVKATSAKSFNTDKEATFTFATPLNIAANATKVVSVRVTLDNNGFFAVGIASASDIVAGGSVTGTFPVNGNTMQATNTASVATVGLDDDGTSASAKFGDDDVVLADFSLTPSGEDVLWTSARLKNGGTNSAEIISNLRVLVDGIETATGSYDSSTGYVTFNINNFLIEDGESVSVEVLGDIGTSNNNDHIKLYIKDRSDFEFIGQDFGYGAQLDETAGGVEEWNDATEGLNSSTLALDVTITVGDVSIDFDKALTPSKDVQPDTDNVVLATLTIISNGENATIEDIMDVNNASAALAKDFHVYGTGLAAAELENFELVDLSTGGVLSLTGTYAADVDLVTGGSQAGYDLNLDDEDVQIVKGVKKTYQLRADVTSTADVNDNVKAVLEGAAMTVTGDVSNASLTNITPSSIDSAVTTVKDAAVEFTVVPLVSKSVVESTQGITIFTGLLETNEVDGVKMTSFKLSATEEDQTDGTDLDQAFTDTNISQLDLYLNGVLLKSLSNQIVEGTDDTSEAAATGSITFNSLSTVNNANVIAKNTTATIEVKARFASTFSFGTVAGIQQGDMFTTFVNDATADIAVRALSDNDDVVPTSDTDGVISGNASESRAVTLATTGNLTVEVKTSGVLADEDSLIVAGTSTSAGKYLAEVVFRTKNESIKVTKLDFDQDGTATGGDIKSIKLVDGSGAVKASTIPDAAGNALFEDLSLTFPADSTTSYYISVETKGINVEGDGTSTATDGMTVQYRFDAAADVEAEGVDTSSDLTMALDAGGGLDIATNEISNSTAESKTVTIVGSKLTSITNVLTNPLDLQLQGGTDKIVAKFKLNFDNAGNRKADDSAMEAKITSFTVSGSKSASATNLALTTFKAYSEAAPSTTVTGTPTGCAATDATCSVVFNLTGLANSGSLDGDVTIVITATVAPTATEGEYVALGLADIDDAVDNGTATSSVQYDSDGDGTAEIGIDGAAVSIDPQAFLGYDFVTGSSITE